jgi:hypothetical protein
MICPDGPLGSAEIRLKYVRNVEVGGSSPLTSTGITTLSLLVSYFSCPIAVAGFVSLFKPLTSPGVGRVR